MVIGLGSPDRGDDAVGSAVADRVREVVGDGVEVLTREDPTALVHAWEGRHVVVLIDSMISGVAAGTVTVRHAGTRDAPLPTYAFAAAGRGGSHAFGLAGAVELSRTLGTLPEHVAIVGIEATRLRPRADVPARGQASIDEAVAAVCAELDQAEWHPRPLHRRERGGDMCLGTVAKVVEVPIEERAVVEHATSDGTVRREDVLKMTLGEEHHARRLGGDPLRIRAREASPMRARQTPSRSVPPRRHRPPLTRRSWRHDTPPAPAASRSRPAPQ